MSYEQETLAQIRKDYDAGQEAGRKLVFDPETRSVRVSGGTDDPDDLIRVRQSDLDMAFGEPAYPGVIVLDTDLVGKAEQNSGSSIELSMAYWPGEEVYSCFPAQSSTITVPGTLFIARGPGFIPISEIGSPADRIRVTLRENGSAPDEASGHRFQRWVPEGFVCNQGEWQRCPVELIPMETELFSRHRGLFETNALADRSVLGVGLSSLGSPIVRKLAEAGVGHFGLIDGDRLEVGNIVRHEATLPHVGRYKTKFMESMIKGKNPYAKITTWEEKLSWENIDLFRELVRSHDLTILAIDEREGKVVANRICLEEGKALIISGAARRAYAGHILFIRPGETLCYQCFLQQVPDIAKDEEVANKAHAERLAYTDRPVPIEPGLSTDIAPISQMVAKLAIQYLLKGRQTTLRTLDEDLVAPWFMWLNRREVGTDFENLKPLAYNVDGLHVLRWYGIKIPRDPHCPVCGQLEIDPGTRD